MKRKQKRKNTIKWRKREKQKREWTRLENKKKTSSHSHASVSCFCMIIIGWLFQLVWYHSLFLLSYCVIKTKPDMKNKRQNTVQLCKHDLACLNELQLFTVKQTHGFTKVHLHQVKKHCKISKQIRASEDEINHNRTGVRLCMYSTHSWLKTLNQTMYFH